MATEIILKVGDNTLTAKGDFPLDEGFQNVVNAWTRALGPNPDQQAVDGLAKTLGEQSDRLEAVVEAAQEAISPLGTTPLVQPQKE